MNTGTAVGTFIFAVVVVVIIGVVMRRMTGGWKRRGERQAELIGQLPPMPDMLGGATIPPTRGLYVGTTLAARRRPGSSASPSAIWATEPRRC